MRIVRPTIIGTTLLCIAAVVGSLTAASLSFLWPTFLPSEYQLNQQEIQKFVPPLYKKTSPSKINITMNMQLNGYYPYEYSITPDDCVERLSINGNIVPLDNPPCLDDRITRIDLGSYLRPGINTLSVIVDDFGGYGGLSINPSMMDSLVIAHILLLALCIIFTVFGSMLLLGATRQTYFVAAILFVGLLLRLGVSQHPGYSYDVNINQGWAKSATVLGIAQSYEQQLDGTMMPNYPPLSMEIFAAMGHIYQSFDAGFDRFSPLLLSMIKFPAMVADLLIATLLFFVLRRYLSDRAGLIGLTVYALHPAAIFNSAIWGQVDSIYTLFIVAALFAGIEKRWWWLGVFGACAVLAKLQSIVLLPLAIVFLVQSKHDAWKIISGGILTAFVVLFPFIVHGNLPHVLNVYVGSVGFYTSLSYGAFNFWHALYGNRVSMDDTGLLFNWVTYRTAGLLLFTGLTVAITTLRWNTLMALKRSPALLMAFHVTTIIAYAFFLFNTEMHERYMFPVIALGIPLLFLSKTTAWLYVAASFLFLLNLLGTLHLFAADKALFNEFSNLASTIGALHVAIFIALFISLLQHTKEAESTRMRVKRLIEQLRSLKLS